MLKISRHLEKVLEKLEKFWNELFREFKKF